MEVPSTSNFADIYPADDLSWEKPRWDTLLTQFRAHFGQSADFVSRSPGRVNLIGEHIDYSLYQCLPMAVTADVLLAVSVHAKPASSSASSKFRIANLDAENFPEREFEIESAGKVSIDATSLEWSNYFKAGLLAASEFLRKKKGTEAFSLASMDILVSGSVPTGSGLSSSAAFVCASALAAMKANGEEIVNKTELVELAIVSERAVGVNSGGLDQSASVFGLRDNALLVSFKPKLEAKPVQFPAMEPELVFVIAQSFVKSDKHTTGPIYYNLRVVECSLAAEVLAKIFKVKGPLPKDAGPLGISLRGFQDAYFEHTSEISDNTQTPVVDLQSQLETLIGLVEDYLVQEDGYTRDDISQILGISVDEINHRYTSTFPVRAERFMLRQRALHVFNEAIRVIKFMKLLNSTTIDSHKLPSELGALLVASQDSCRDVYNCSCPELDEMCQIAIKAGAYGSRLTGAGWGGCSVHLVPKDKVDAVSNAWRTEYYNKRFPNLSEEKLRDAIVVSKPGSGSLVYNIEGRLEV